MEENSSLTTPDFVRYVPFVSDGRGASFELRLIDGEPHWRWRVDPTLFSNEPMQRHVFAEEAIRIMEDELGLPQTFPTERTAKKSFLRDFGSTKNILLHSGSGIVVANHLDLQHKVDEVNVYELICTLSNGDYFWWMDIKAAIGEFYNQPREPGSFLLRYTENLTLVLSGEEWKNILQERGLTFRVIKNACCLCGVEVDTLSEFCPSCARSLKRLKEWWRRKRMSKKLRNYYRYFDYILV